MRKQNLALVSSIAALILPLLAGCDSKADAAYRRIAAKERDVVPLSYRGPLTVEAVDGLTTEIAYSENGKRRIDRSYSSGSSHSLWDFDGGVLYRWTDFGPDRGMLRISILSGAAYERWRGKEKAQRLGPCSAAGERGFIYRHTRRPNVKEPGGVYEEACITRDGVVLSESGGAEILAGKGFHSPPVRHFVATTVRRGPLPPGVFSVPTSLRRVRTP